MGRPTVYGKEVVLTSGGEFAGINLGFNFYCEHEGELEEVCDDFNELWRYRNTGLVGKMKLKKIAKESLKFANTRYGKYMILPVVHYYRRVITVDNSKCTYPVKLMEDGKWGILVIGVSSDVDQYCAKFSSKKVFSEAEIFYMEDYQGCGRVHPSALNTGICGSWGCGYSSLTVTVKLDRFPNVINGIVDALTAGHLAIYPGADNVFKSRGCCLVDVTKIGR